MPDSTPESPMRISRSRLRRGGLAAGVALIAIVSIGIGIRHSQAQRLEKWTHAQAVPTVEVTRIGNGTAGSILELPARIEAYARAPIYARVSGYVRSWSADIGTHVKAGQPLAVIEIPDLEEQLAQARADLASARANAALAARTAHRWEALVGSGLVSRQETDQKVSALAARNAAVRAAEARVGRIEAMKRYARVVAPFDGIVTARNTDVGQLINAGDNGPGHELFVVSDVRRLRVYVQVPQSDAPSVIPGATAMLSVPGYPGHGFPATVVASAGAVSASSGSTLVQLVMSNPGEKILPGSFAIARFQLAANPDAPRVPADALIFDRHGLRVATVGRDDRVRFRRVSIAHDYGDSVQIGSGVLAGELVIDSPPDGLLDGDRVRPAPRTKGRGPFAERGAPVARSSSREGAMQPPAGAGSRGTGSPAIRHPGAADVRAAVAGCCTRPVSE